MSNPVTTHHGVEIYLAKSEFGENLRELVIVACVRKAPHGPNEHKRRMLPGIVLDSSDRRELIAALMDAWDGAPAAPAFPEVAPATNYAELKRKIVREACEEAGVRVSWLKDKRRENSADISRARARAVRKLVEFFSYSEAGFAVGISNHTSVVYWVTGKGKDKYR